MALLIDGNMESTKTVITGRTVNPLLHVPRTFKEYTEVKSVLVVSYYVL